MRRYKNTECIRIAEKEIAKGLYYQCFYHINLRTIMFAIWRYDKEKAKTYDSYVGDIIDVFRYSERNVHFLRHDCVEMLLADDAVRVAVGLLGGFAT